MTTLTHWTTLTLTDGTNDLDVARELGRENERVLRALRSLRDHGTMDGLWVCTAAELEEYGADGDDTADAGLGAEDIDWTGLDGDEAQIRALVARAVEMARAEGYRGDGGDYELTAADCRWITEQLGYRPLHTRWVEAGVSGIGRAHCA
jgi:hypothetical protein